MEKRKGTSGGGVPTIIRVKGTMERLYPALFSTLNTFYV